jgi:hypothetical protein
MNSIRNYLSEVFVELKKANWPWNSKEKGFAKYFDTLLRGSFQALIDTVAK